MLTGSKRSLATKNVGARTCPISKDSRLVMPAYDEDLVRAERLAAKQSRELLEVQAEQATGLQLLLQALFEGLG